MRRAPLVWALGFAAPGLAAQAPPAQLIQEAVAHIAARRLDSADALLRIALDSGSAATTAERQAGLIWHALVADFLGDRCLARNRVRGALALDSSVTVSGLERAAPAFGVLFAEEKMALAHPAAVYLAQRVDQPPERVSGPPLAYPPALLHRGVEGWARVTVVVDTLGRVESVEIDEVPDSALIGAVSDMARASRFTPGRRCGKALRVLTALRIEVRPPRLSSPELARRARALLARRQTDSALGLLELALGPLAQPSDAERAFARLVRATARAAAGNDSAAAGDVRAGLALYDSVIARGTDLAPVVRRLADSLRRAPRAGRATLAAPGVVGAADQAPTLVSHPPVRYPREAAQLGIGGTVVVEALVDAGGRVDSASARVVQSGNPALNAEALRLVRGAVYRPARSGGRAVRAVVRQAVTFVAY